MALTDAERLRQMLGESIPSGGSDEETLFSEREIDDFLLRGEGDLNKAAYHGWVAKSGIYANMADVQEGVSREALGRLFEMAQTKVDEFGGLSGLLPGRSRHARIGRVVRR